MQKSGFMSADNLSCPSTKVPGRKLIVTTEAIFEIPTDNYALISGLYSDSEECYQVFFWLAGCAMPTLFNNCMDCVLGWIVDQSLLYTTCKPF